MKTILNILVASIIAISVLAISNCTLTPEQKQVVISNAEKDLLAAGGALIVSGGNGGAVLAAVGKQELENIPALKKAIDNASANDSNNIAVKTTDANPSAVIPVAPIVIETKSGK